MRDGSDMLRTFARAEALRLIHLWDAPPAVRLYLETGREAVRAAAKDEITAWAKGAGRPAAWAGWTEEADSDAVWPGGVAAWAAAAAARAAAADGSVIDARVAVRAAARATTASSSARTAARTASAKRFNAAAEALFA